MAQLELVTMLILRLQDNFCSTFLIKVFSMFEGVFLQGLHSRVYCVGNLTKTHSSCFISVTEGIGAEERVFLNCLFFKDSTKSVYLS